MPTLVLVSFDMVPQVGLEPTRISPLASKTSVATITPPGQNTYFKFLMNVTNCLVYVYYNIKTLSCQQLFYLFLHMIVSSANNLCNYYIVYVFVCQRIYKISLLYFYNWHRLEESNSYSHFRRVLYYPLYEGGIKYLDR
jgi:hypothetical protein